MKTAFFGLYSLTLASTDPTMLHFEPPTRDQGFRMDGYYVWCGSPIRGADGQYHLFASRWPRELTFHPGWLTDSEVVRAVSPSPTGPFTFVEVVLPRRGHEYWDGCMTHNPRIVACGGKYLLFYTGSTYPFPRRNGHDGADNSTPITIVARSNKRVGVAVADRLEGPWTRFDQPILPTKPNSFYSFLTSNPSPVVNPDGSIYLMFKSRAYEGWKHSPMSIGAAVAPRWDAPYRVLTEQSLFGKDRLGEIEDPFVWRDDNGFGMIAKDMNGVLGGASADGILATSPDGIRWTPHGPAYTRTVTWADGGTENLSLLERPQILFEEGRPAYFYAAAALGQPYSDPTVATWNLAMRIDRSSLGSGSWKSLFGESN